MRAAILIIPLLALMACGEGPTKPTPVPVPCSCPAPQPDPVPEPETAPEPAPEPQPEPQPEPEPQPAPDSSDDSGGAPDRPAETAPELEPELESVPEQKSVWLPGERYYGELHSREYRRMSTSAGTWGQPWAHGLSMRNIPVTWVCGFDATTCGDDLDSEEWIKVPVEEAK